MLYTVDILHAGCWCIERNVSNLVALCSVKGRPLNIEFLSSAMNHALRAARLLFYEGR